MYIRPSWVDEFGTDTIHYPREDEIKTVYHAPTHASESKAMQGEMLLKMTSSTMQFPFRDNIYAALRGCFESHEFNESAAFTRTDNQVLRFTMGRNYAILAVFQFLSTAILASIEATGVDRENARIYLTRMYTTGYLPPETEKLIQVEVGRIATKKFFEDAEVKINETALASFLRNCALRFYVAILSKDGMKLQVPRIGSTYDAASMKVRVSWPDSKFDATWMKLHASSARGPTGSVNLPRIHVYALQAERHCALRLAPCRVYGCARGWCNSDNGSTGVDDGRIGQETDIDFSTAATPDKSRNQPGTAERKLSAYTR